MADPDSWVGSSCHEPFLAAAMAEVTLAAIPPFSLFATPVALDDELIPTVDLLRVRRRLRWRGRPRAIAPLLDFGLSSAGWGQRFL